MKGKNMKDEKNIVNLKKEKEKRKDERLDDLLDSMIKNTAKMEKYFTYKAIHRSYYFKQLLNGGFTREEAMQILLNEEK